MHYLKILNESFIEVPWPVNSPFIYQIIAIKIINKTTFYQDSESGFFSLLLFYLLYSERKISEDGYKIGFCDLSSNSNRIDCPNNEFILSEGSFLIYDLNQQSEELRPNFENFTAKDVYNSLFLNLPHLVQ